jgi:hypothetical protein
VAAVLRAAAHYSGGPAVHHDSGQAVP